MTMRFDWKFWIVLIATLAGVLVPVWLWRADLTSRSLHFRKVSQTSLQPPDSAKVPDLQITLAGTELATPYLTVFELSNDGAKPVLSSDFESPIELAPTNKALVARTSVTGTSPKYLVPAVVVENGSMKIQPMLLNPGDSMTIAVLTSGEEPVFSSRARIAGIRSIPIIDEQTKQKSPGRMAVVLLTSLVCLVAASLVVDGWPSKGSQLRPRSAFIVFVVSASAGALLMISSLEAFGVEGFLPFGAAFIIGMLLASLISEQLNRPLRDSEQVGSERRDNPPLA